MGAVNVPPVLPGCEIVRPAHLAETGGTLARTCTDGLCFACFPTNSLTFTSICLVDRSFLLSHWAGRAGKPNGLVRLKSAVRPEWLSGPSRLQGGFERRRSRRPAISVMAENGVSLHDSRQLLSLPTDPQQTTVS